MEWLFSFMAMAYGLVLANPYSHVFEHAPQYAILAQIADEQVWGIFSFCFGFCRALFLFVNGRWFRTAIPRCFCSIASMMWYVSLCWLVLEAGTTIPPATIWFPVLAMAETYNIRAAMIDAWHMQSFRLHDPRQRPLKELQSSAYTDRR